MQEQTQPRYVKETLSYSKYLIDLTDIEKLTNPVKSIDGSIQTLLPITTSDAVGWWLHK